MRKRNQKDQSSNHSRAGKKQLVGKNLWTLALNLPPNGLPPSLGCPSSGSWTSSGRSSQWRSRSWWLGPQTAEWVSPLYFWLPGVIHFLMFLKKDMFKSTATSSGLAKVAASHFRTFLDGHKKMQTSIENCSDWSKSGLRLLAQLHLRAQQGHHRHCSWAEMPQYSDVLHLTKESSVPYG